MRPPTILALSGLLALALAAHLAAERKGSVLGMWLTKPIASACFVLLAIPPVDPWLFAAILLSFVGDVLLIPKDARVFRAGIVAFLVAHLAFVAAFAARGIHWAYAAGALVPLALLAWVIARWILPTVPAALKPAVIAYIVVITTMVAAAVGAVAAGADPLLLVAAIAFYLNDILVARDRFVTKDWRNRLVGLPLYYGAMVLFALQASASG